jgi:hypothetical protein
MFPGKVRDVELSCGEPFELSHSGYFTNADVHRLLAGIVLGSE